VRTYVAGIVNVTPDSFSGDGRTDAVAAADHAIALLEEGADLVDIGAESTRPGHTPVDARVELARLLPALRRLRERAPGALVSVDTFKTEVFLAAHAAGADILNSVWGLDDALLGAAAECGAPAVIMHNKHIAVYAGDIVDEVLEYLSRQAQRALDAGLPRDHIILDPGIGFGKGPEHNLALLHNLERLVALGFPTMVGTSRKSTIGKLTGREVSARAFGTAATVALAAAKGIDVVRVHDVAAMVDVVRVSDAIARGWRPPDWHEDPR
jgi:dihydropteroate synthase